MARRTRTPLTTTPPTGATPAGLMRTGQAACYGAEILNTSRARAGQAKEGTY